MGYTVSGLTDYVKQQADNLVYAAMFNGKTIDYIKQYGNVKTGIKSSEDIEVIASTVGFQADGCGFESSGTTTFTKVNLVVGKIKVNQDFCEKDLETKYTQLRLKKGSMYEDLAFEKEISEIHAGKIAEKLEVAIWSGDTTSGNDDLLHFNGLRKLIKAGSPVDANTAAYISGAPIAAGTGIVASNVISIFNGVYKAIPAALLGKNDVKIFCGQDVYRTYQLALVAANYFNYAGNVATDELVIPGTNITVVPVHGLNGTSEIFAFSMSNIWLGTDLENEEERFEIYFAKEADKMRFDCRFKMGVQVAFTNECVKFVLA